MHLFFQRILWITAIALLGCNSISLQQNKPPITETTPHIKEHSFNGENPVAEEKTLDNFYADHPTIPTLWWVRYHKARIWQASKPQKSCQHYAWLSEQKDFPLRDIAYLRSIQFCEDKKPSNLAEPERENRWFKELWITAQSTLSERSNDQKLKMELLISKSKRSLIKHEKVSLTEKALIIAHKLEDQNKIKELNGRLEKISPKFIKSPSHRQLISKANDHRFYREFDQAKSLYDQILKSKKSSHWQVYQALKEKRRLYKLQRDKVKTLAATKAMAQFAKKRYKSGNKHFLHKYKQAQILYARTTWTQGNSKHAIQLLRSLAKDLKGKSSLEKVFWLRGRLDEEAKNYKSAERWYNRSLEECVSQCSMNGKLLWSQAWAQKKSGQLQKAHKTLTILSMEGDADIKPKVSFWNAKVVQEMGDDGLAKLLFEQTLAEDPIGYYGVLAQKELFNAVLPLEKKLELQKQKSDSLATQEISRKKSFLATDEGVKVLWLISVEEKDLAQKFIHQVSRKYLKTHAYEARFWEEIFKVYSQSKSYQNLLQRFWQLPESLRIALLQEQPELVFPQPYKDLVEASTNEAGIPSELVYSIMRQESLFNHQARSPADAFGLMQLIPSLAKKLSPKHNVSYSSPQDLFKPDVNITLGSAHLKALWDKYQGQFILMTASYNASEKAIRGWVRHRFEGNPLEFIEDIPYQETQKYVKLVLRNFVLYQRIQSKEEKMPFPEWCLKNIHSHNT